MLLIFLSLFSCSKSDTRIITETLVVRHEGADMPAYVHGNLSPGKLLVVLHGAGSNGLAFRSGVFTERLEEEYVVVYWDQRGQGMSEGNYDEPDDLIGLLASDVHALTRVLQERFGNEVEIYLMGHSWGGALGLTALLDQEFRGKISGWIGVSGAHDFPMAAQARRAQILAVADEQVAAGNAVESWQEIRTATEALDSLSDDDYHEILRYAGESMKLLLQTGVVGQPIGGEQLFRSLVDNNPLTWMVSNLFNQPVQTAIDQDYSLTGQLAEIDVPALFIYGKYDMSVPPLIGKDGYGKYGSADKELVIFGQSMHHPFFSEPDLFEDLVTGFMESNFK